MQANGDSTSNLNRAILGFSARAAAECACRAGYRPIVVDYCGDRDLLSLACEFYSMADPGWTDWLVTKASKIPLVVTGGMEHQQANLTHFFAQSEDPNNLVTTIRELRSVQNWKRWAEASNIVWPQSVFVTNKPLPPQETSSTSAWLLKSNESVGGFGIHDWPIPSHLASNIDLNVSPSPYYLQEKIPGISIGVTFLSSVHGSTLLGVVQSAFHDTQPFMPPYVYRGSVGPLCIDASLISKLSQFANLASKESKVLGLWQADFILNGTEVALLEINPRWSASMEILDGAYDERLVRWHLACLQESIEIEQWQELTLRSETRIQSEAKRIIGKQIHYAANEFIVTDTISDAWFRKRWQGASTLDNDVCFYADIPFKETRILAGQPILTSMVVADTVQQAVSETLHRLD